EFRRVLFRSVSSTTLPPMCGSWDSTGTPSPESHTSNSEPSQPMRMASLSEVREFSLPALFLNAPRWATTLLRWKSSLTSVKLSLLSPVCTVMVYWKEGARSEEHTSELQSRENLVCRLLLE